MSHSYLSDIIPPTQSSHALSSDLKHKPFVLAVKFNYKWGGYNIFSQRGDTEDNSQKQNDYEKQGSKPELADLFI
jgi:hypothetical protein